MAKKIKKDYLYGRRFGKLVVDKSYNKSGKKVCDCECDCGNEVLEVPYSKLIKSTIRSCGKC
jgi:hypothetical protein